jgi:hypothetical protein
VKRPDKTGPQVRCPACAEHVPPCYLCHGTHTVSPERATVYEHISRPSLDEPGHDMPTLERLDDDQLDEG